jgi:hypothetical protein
MGAFIFRVAITLSLCVLVVRPKVSGFKPGRGDGFLREIKIRSTGCFQGKVKPKALCRKILWHVKKTSKYDKNNFQGQILIHFAHSSCSLPDDSAGKNAREFWWKNQEFSSVDMISALVLHARIT